MSASKPTKEQTEAAKALLARVPHVNKMELLIAAETLLRALEAAEEYSARLATAIDEAIDNASGRWCEWGERAEESFRILRAARKAQL